MAGTALAATPAAGAARGGGGEGGARQRGDKIGREVINFCISRAASTVEAWGAIGPATNCKIGDEDIDWPGSRYRANLESTSLQRVDPGVGHDRDTIGSPEPERKHCARGH